MKIAIYQTSDLHGYVYPTDYVNPQELGILKIGSYILEDEKKYEGSLKIDCGDLIQGSALAGYLVNQKAESPLSKVLQHIGYDAYVLGNHEFNYGLDYLAKVYTPLQEQVLNANINGLPFESKPYQIYNFDNYSIGVIGLTTSFIPNWEQPKNIVGLSFDNPIEVYRKYEEELKAKSDFIIVAYHGGFEKSIDEDFMPTEALTKENQGSELLEVFDSIDVVLSGHQHRSFITKVKNTIITQPLNNGVNFAKIVVDTESKECSYQLVQVKEEGIIVKEELEAYFSEVSLELEEYLKQGIANIGEDLHVHDVFEARLKGHPFINLLHEVQLEASGADISVLSLFDSSIGFSKEVTVKEIIVNYPYPNTFKVLEITGKKLKEAIEKSATYFMLEDGDVKIHPSFLFPKLQNYNYDTFGGIEYVVDLHLPMNERVVSIKYQGKEVEENQMFKVVMNNYRASNTSIYPAYDNVRVVKDIQQEMSELLISYFERNKAVEVKKESNFKFIY